MKEEAIRVLREIKFAERYIEICINHQQDLHNGVTIKKSDVERVLDQNHIDLDYLKGESAFHKETTTNNFQTGFSVCYKGGLIECFSSYSCLEQGFRIGSRFDGIAEYQDEKFTEKVRYPIPIVASIPEFEDILPSLIEMHFEIVAAFELKNICQGKI